MEPAVYRIDRFHPDPLGSTVYTRCHCNGNHLLEIPGTVGMEPNQDPDGTFTTTDLTPITHKPPVKKGDKVTMVDPGGKTAAASVDRVTLSKMKRWFPGDQDSLAWVLELRRPS